MTILKLRVDKYLEGQKLLEFGAIANIYPLPGRTGERTTGRKAIHNLLVPTVDPFPPNIPYKEVSLEPGRYLVEAILPSGEVLRDEVMILEDAPPSELKLKGEASPHEWLTWHHFYGMVQGSESYHERELVQESLPKSLRPGTVRLVSTVTKDPTIPYPLIGPPTSLNLISRGLFFTLPEARSLEPGDPLIGIFSTSELVHPASVSGPLSTYYQDQLSQVFKFNSSSLPLVPGFDAWNGDYQTTKFVRHYLFASGEGIPPQYCVVPIPSMLPESESDREAEVMVLVQLMDPADEPSAGFDQGCRLAVVVADEVIGAMVGYLGSGRLDAAASIIQQARDRLWQKKVNPLAAAAGAYVMIANWEPGQADYWHKWVSHLMNWFPWLPDGAIQYAWVQLKTRRDLEGLQEARKALLEGYWRGLPFFSKGVSLLLDGLSRYAHDAREAGPPDVEVEEALKVVRLMALRTNPRQPFTTVLLR